jgi:hypothetical protein
MSLYEGRITTAFKDIPVGKTFDFDVSELRNEMGARFRFRARLSDIGVIHQKLQKEVSKATKELTPVDLHTSKIHKPFLEGTQERFYIH